MKFSADVDALLLLVSCQDPGHKFGCDTVHAQFFRQNLLACPITNSHFLSNVVNGLTSVLTDELLNLTLRLLMSYIYGAPILDVSRSHTTTQHSR